MDDASKSYWRRQFTPMLHSHLPQIETLIETADKLDAARGFVEPLSPSVDGEREQGMFVASLAIRYGIETLEHFGLVDGDDPPMPVNLAQAKQVLTKVGTFIHESIRHGRLAVRAGCHPKPQGHLGRMSSFWQFLTPCIIRDPHEKRHRIHRTEEA